MTCVFHSTVQFRKQETHLFMLRVLVGLIILYDHVHPNGAFVKTSNIDIKGCVRLLKDQPEEFQTENLLNALRYNKTENLLLYIVDNNNDFYNY